MYQAQIQYQAHPHTQTHYHAYPQTHLMHQQHFPLYQNYQPNQAYTNDFSGVVSSSKNMLSGTQRKSLELTRNLLNTDPHQIQSVSSSVSERDIAKSANIVKEQEDFLKRLDEEKKWEKVRRKGDGVQVHQRSKWQDSRDKKIGGLEQKYRSSRAEISLDCSSRIQSKERSSSNEDTASVASRVNDKTCLTYQEHDKTTRNAQKLMNKYRNSHHHTSQVSQTLEPYQSDGYFREAYEPRTPGHPHISSPMSYESPGLYNKTASPKWQRTRAFESVYSSPGDTNYSVSDLDRVIISCI